MDERVELADQGDNIIRTHDISVDIDQSGLGHKLFWSMKKFKNAVAQIEAATGERDTYDTLLTKCIRTAIHMRKKGVRPNDIIMPCTTNHIDTSVPFFAAFFVGARVASLDPSLSLSDMKHLINLTKPKLIFASSNAIDSIEESLNEIPEKPEIVVFGSTTEKHTGFSEFLSPSEQEDTFLPTEADDILETALVLFTSGSTGMSKGICISHLCILARTGYSLTSLFTPKIMIIYSPLYWLSAVCTRFMCVLSGATLLIASNYTPEKTFDYLEKYKVTHTFFSPAESISLLKHGRKGDAKFPNLEFVFISGGFLSAANLWELRKMFVNATVFFAFGQTEILGIVLGLPKDENGAELFLKKGNTVGKPARGNWYKVVDPETEKVLGPNQNGELRLKTKYVMNGYYNLDSSSAWDSDGWFKTGDICYYDEDHFFYVVDRLKELIKFRGWHIAPAFLESVLHQHPAVKTAVVIGVPNEDDVEHALGLVELHEDFNNTTTTSEELVKFVSERTGDDKKVLHGGIRFITDVPYTPTGKVKRNELRKKILEDIIEKS